MNLSNKQKLILSIGALAVISVSTGFLYLRSQTDSNDIFLTENAEESTTDAETVESSVEEEVEESIISNVIPANYHGIEVQNNLIIAKYYEDTENWDIFNTNLEKLNSISNVPFMRDEMANSIERGRTVEGTAVLEVSENAVYSTFLNTQGELDKINIGQTTSSMLNTQTQGECGVVPLRTGNQVRLVYLPVGDREQRFDTIFGTMSGAINKNSFVPLIYTNEDRSKNIKTFVQIYDASLIAIGDKWKEPETISTVNISTVDLVTASNLNDKNRLMYQSYTTGLVDDVPVWSLYDMNKNTTFTFPENIQIFTFNDFGINYEIGSAGLMGNIGNADNYIFRDLNDSVEPNEETPSMHDMTMRKFGIISAKGEIIKEPFATLMGEPNTNGVSWYTSDEGLYGLINVNTGEIVKEPFAYMISTFNSNKIATMMLNEGDNYSIIDEKGNIIEETDYAYVSSFTDDNLASYREYSNRPLGVLKVDFEN